MSIKLLNFREIDTSKIEYLPPQKQRNSHFSRAQYNGEDIYIKTTKLLNNNGMIKNDNRAYIDLEFGENNDFYDFMCNLDESCINAIHINSENWFNKEFPKDIIEEFYLGPLKHKAKPKLKMKIPLSKQSIDCLVYDNVGNCTQDIGVNNSIICVLQFIGLKFLKQQVIAEWRPIQIKTSNIIQVQTKNFLIEDNLDEEDSDIDSLETENDTFEESHIINSGEDQNQNQNNTVQEELNLEDNQNEWTNNLNEVNLENIETESEPEAQNKQELQPELEVQPESNNSKSEVEKELEKYKDQLRTIKSQINSILLD